jgi:hypothetical protein
VGALLRKLTEGHPLSKRLAEARALQSWPDIVGPMLARRTRPLRVAGGSLFVVAHGSALRQELTFHRRTILRQFNEAAGTRTAREIVFLESDAALSSLVMEHEAWDAGDEDRRRNSPGDAGAAAEETEPTDESDASDSEAEPCRSIAPAHRVFDAAAYRSEMAAIARMSETSGGERVRT